MSNTTIHYVTFDSPEKVLIRESEFENQEYVYSKCPVHTHKQNRVFVGLSPIDFSLRVTRKTGEMNHIVCDDPNLITWDDEHVMSPKPVIQLKIPKWLFWTNEDDVWFDFYDHPMTALNNNFVAVPGWFNLSNWSRGCSLALTIVNESKPVIIKKGDPLFRVAFHPPNLNDGIMLAQEKDPQKIDFIYEEYDKKMKEGQADKRWKPKLFSETGKSKCPFSFLFK